jgi:hypothetical protein
MDRLAIAIKLLLSRQRATSDDSEENFAFQRQLCMFQFQYWLLGAANQDLAFGKSAAMFGAAALSCEISKRKLGRRDSFLLAVASKNMEQVINRCFGARDNIYELLKVGPSPLSKKGYDFAAAEIRALNAVLEVRLRLHAAGHSSSLNNTWRMIPVLAPGIGRATALKPLLQRRKQRQPFLYAARQIAPEFLTMNFEGSGAFIAPESLLSQMGAKAKNQEAFRKLCAAAKAVAKVIEVKWSKEMEGALADLEGELPDMEPIPAELLPAKVPRRAATETKKADRLQVEK